jgi:hypothetical protein
MNQDRCHELLNRFLSEQISDDEIIELEAALLSDDELRRLYYQYLDLNLGLHQEMAPGEMSEPVQELRQALEELPMPSISTANGIQQWLWPVAAAICLLIAVFSLFARQPASAAMQSFVGTVVQVEGDVSSWRSGDRIPEGTTKISSGSMRLRLDGGALINLTAPAEINFYSKDHAALKYGDLTMRCPASAIGFQLDAPGLKTVDLGTEFGVSARRGRTALHVFDGEVEWSASERSGLVEAGEAIQSQRNGRALDSFKADASLFDRDFSKHPSTLPGLSSSMAKPLAYEGFAYRSGKLGLSDGGTGWSSSWMRGRTDLPIGLMVRAERSLRLKDGSPSESGLLELEGSKAAWRRLSKPIDLSEKQRFYGSFLLRRLGPVVDPNRSFALVGLQSSADARNLIGVGVNESQQILLFNAGANKVSNLDFPTEETRLIIFRIDSHPKFPTEVSACVYESIQSLPPGEPIAWHAQSQTRPNNGVLDYLTIRNRKGARYDIDEIRLGASWESVLTDVKN